ncbi:MAG TPA: gliding motility-associated C-terminal domain-containing protein, partial [Saprospiraceae bacterium]|nr:gliding motility-associated C-terminal domain-containing protein [Saprospiraceae bacterium]
MDQRIRLFAPNAFSPNDDGINDVFMLFGGNGVERVAMLRIFDRWGNMMFEARDFLPGDPQFGWN